jgi:hypothetical protein
LFARDQCIGIGNSQVAKGGSRMVH